MSNDGQKYLLTATTDIKNFDIVVKIDKNTKLLEKFIYFNGGTEEESHHRKEIDEFRRPLVGHLPHEFFGEIEKYFELPADSLLSDFFNGIFLTTLDHCYMTVFGKYMDDVIEHKEKTRDFEFILVFLLFLVRNKLTKTLPRIIVWDVDNISTL